MAYRIELLFVGDAPDDELKRAQILANDKVTSAIQDLSSALTAAGLDPTVTAHVVRSTEKRKNSGRKPAIVRDAAE